MKNKTLIGSISVSLAVFIYYLSQILKLPDRAFPVKQVVYFILFIVVILFIEYAGKNIHPKIAKFILHTYIIIFLIIIPALFISIFFFDFPLKKEYVKQRLNSDTLITIPSSDTTRIPPGVPIPLPPEKIAKLSITLNKKNFKAVIKSCPAATFSGTEYERSADLSINKIYKIYLINKKDTTIIFEGEITKNTEINYAE